MLSRELIQGDIDKLRDSVGEEYSIPQFILRQGKFSEPVDVEYLAAERRLMKKIMAEEKVKEWTTFVKELDEKPKKTLSVKHKNVLRKRILEESNRESYDFPKTEKTPKIRGIINQIRYSKGVKSSVLFRTWKWPEMNMAEQAEVRAVQAEKTEEFWSQRRAASRKACLAH